ncbi:hypothetical protein D9619_005995 [Psilocybe cf. subviscida]|uniref:Uncharacterized protein n=1 Tax=Psilocybe cf. subviscida TaxID=2480587 RepID=A0A8H5BX57_9AGAR|nr:hypothetical protein D9619_005995 [Psilocybe cf. subviscida]
MTSLYLCAFMHVRYHVARISPNKRLSPLFQSHLLPPSNAWPTAFNNTAVQVLKVKPDGKGSASRAVVTLSSSNSSTRPALRSSQSAPDAPRPPEDDDNSDSGKGNDGDEHAQLDNNTGGHADENANPARDSSVDDPESDSEETDKGIVPMDAYMAIFDDALLLPWRTSASASVSQSARGPGKPPQAPQSSVSTLQHESPTTTSDVGTERG